MGDQKQHLRFLKRYGAAFMSGILAGLAAAIFLHLLDWATQTRQNHQAIIWALPLAGFFIGWVYHQYGKDVATGNDLILDEIHDPKKTVPIKMVPFILISTVLTHLFGGSAGREGTAVQMGASLSDQLSKFFKVNPSDRKILLMAGAGAGFGAAIGAPWAGAIFSIEVIHVGRLKISAWIECLCASFVAYFTTLALHAPHSVYPRFQIPDFDLKTLFFVALAGIIFGLATKIFIIIIHFVEKIFAKFISYSPLRPLIAGILIVILFYWEGTYRYAGLGISTIQEALKIPGHFRDPVLKTFFTSLTVGTGFKGGEFIPLVFIGTTLGSALAIIIPVSFQLLAALGFAAVFAGAANTPIACSVMAMELFGPKIGAYSLLACYASFCFSGQRGIYKAQK